MHHLMPDDDDDHPEHEGSPPSPYLRAALNADPSGEPDDYQNDDNADVLLEDLREAPSEPLGSGESLDTLTARHVRQGGRSAERTIQTVVVDLTVLADATSDPDRHAAEWDEFFHGYYERLLDFFAYSVPDVDERKDLVQSIFFRAYKANVLSDHPLQSVGAAWSWLLTIGRNLLRDGYDSEGVTRRTLKRHEEYMLVEVELHHHAADVLEQLAAEDLFGDGRWPIDQETFEERMEQLTDEDRLLLNLRFTKGLEWQGVAASMGKSSAAVRKQFSRLAKFLREG